MPEDKKYPINIRITIESASNGIVVTGHPAGTHEVNEDMRYVYKDIKKASREIPSIFSVLMAEKPDETDEDLEKMKKSINKGEY